MGKSWFKILANKYYDFKYQTRSPVLRMETQVSNGSEHMPEHRSEGVFSYSTLDQKIFRYEKYTEEQLQEFAQLFPTEIFFVLTGTEVEEIEGPETIEDAEAGVCSGVEGEHHPLCVVETVSHDAHIVDVVHNLKEDFIYYHATINGISWWECTCTNFLETDAKGVDRMLKRVVAHARKTGHAINPRGN